MAVCKMSLEKWCNLSILIGTIRYEVYHGTLLSVLPQIGTVGRLLIEVAADQFVWSRPGAGGSAMTAVVHGSRLF